MKTPIHSVLFDLDGTLLDTAPDLAATLNALLVEEQREPLPLASVRPWISLGAATMIKKDLV
jgi:phosphoglycolate phosphatase-like HAD superfamily hydrolase